MIRLLTFSTLYPNSVTPAHGIFVETRLRQLLRSGHVEARVVAPVPWFPVKHRIFKRYAGKARVPRREILHGIEVRHPRYVVVPKIGMNASPFTLALAAIPEIARLRRGGYEFDAIDAHYYYPDGVAAAIVARHFRKPLVITARGSDLNLISNYGIPRRLMQWAGRQASYSVCVSRALQDTLIRLGFERERVVVLRNGVDLELFTPIDRTAARRSLGLHDVRTFVSVGHLLELKGHDLAIRAIANAFPAAQLVIVGDGERRQALQELAADLGVAERVSFTGAVPQDRLKEYFSAADALILASSREGWPNVLLESMACGTPVVATSVGGIPEIVAVPEAGIVVPDRTPEAIARGLARLLSAYPAREATRAYAQRFSWDDTTRGQLRIFEALTKSRAFESDTPPVRVHDSRNAGATQQLAKPD
jgi:teichuronic acid biosynthesis glycosyltransferase TuaC